MIWGLMAFLCLSVPENIHKMVRRGGPDKVGVDEEQEKYPALELDDLCKSSKNPKCEPIVDRYCEKSCSPRLCGKRGSIRSMCRLICEAEDLVPECLKRGPTQFKKKKKWNSNVQPYLNNPLPLNVQPGPFGQDYLNQSSLFPHGDLSR